jgi:hypothetical protein
MTATPLPPPRPPARLSTRVARDLQVRARWAVLALVLLAACGGRTKEDIVGKARSVSTRAELEKALGTPSDIAKLGPIERWTYQATNGEVVFIVIGDAVTMQAAGGTTRKD